MLIPARLMLIASISITAIAVLLLGGCNGPGLSDGQKYSIAVDTYRASTTAMLVASRSGAVKPAEFWAFEDTIQKPASAMLDRWADAIAAKRPFAELAALNALLDEMVSAKVVAERKARDAPKRSLAPPTPRTRHVARVGRNQRHQDRNSRRARLDPGRVRRGRFQEARCGCRHGDRERSSA